MLAEYQNLFYNTTSSQAISACGEYLFAGNNFGDIFVFRYMSDSIVFNFIQLCRQIIIMFRLNFQYITSMCKSRRTNV